MFIVEGADSFTMCLIAHINDFLKEFFKNLYTQLKNMTQQSCSLVVSEPHLKWYSIKKCTRRNQPCVCMPIHIAKTWEWVLSSRQPAKALRHCLTFNRNALVQRLWLADCRNSCYSAWYICRTVLLSVGFFVNTNLSWIRSCQLCE